MQADGGSAASAAMAAATARVQALLDDYFEVEDAGALAAAAALCRGAPVDVDAVLAHARRSGAPAATIARAVAALRKALGLPAVPGAPCRKSP
jgi:hypothetical protein